MGFESCPLTKCAVYFGRDLVPVSSFSKWAHFAQGKQTLQCLLSGGLSGMFQLTLVWSAPGRFDIPTGGDSNQISSKFKPSDIFIWTGKHWAEDCKPIMRRMWCGSTTDHLLTATNTFDIANWRHVCEGKQICFIGTWLVASRPLPSTSSFRRTSQVLGGEEWLLRTCGFDLTTRHCNLAASFHLC